MWLDFMSQTIARPYLITLALGICATIIFLIIRVKKAGLPGTIAKTVASILFIATALAAIWAVKYSKISSHDTSAINMSYYLPVILGLACGMLGDVWLDLKFCYPQDNDVFTFTGFISFIFGHIAYITAIFCYGSIQLRHLLVAGGTGIAAAIIILISEKPMKLNYGKFKGITVFYAFIILFMAVLAGAVALWNDDGIVDKTMLVLAIAGGFFAVSDLILSGTYFGEGKNRPVDVVTNHVTYYIAQYLIASSILFLD